MRLMPPSLSYTRGYTHHGTLSHTHGYTHHGTLSHTRVYLPTHRCTPGYASPTHRCTPWSTLVGNVHPVVHPGGYMPPFPLS